MPLIPASQTLTQADIKRIHATALRLVDSLAHPGLRHKHAAQSVFAGRHGLKRQGSGTDFWQIRDFRPSESASMIDWRTSAKSETLYVREKERSVPHTLGLWADMSGSMHFCSEKKLPTKAERALELMISLGYLTVRSEESFMVPGILRSSRSKGAPEQLVNRLPDMISRRISLPPRDTLTRRSFLILIGDFLDPLEALREFMDALFAQNIKAIFVQVLDPAEEAFSYSGRTRFIDPETGSEYELQRAEDGLSDYKMLFLEHVRTLKEQVKRRGWQFYAHCTTQEPRTLLLTLERYLDTF